MAREWNLQQLREGGAKAKGVIDNAIDALADMSLDAIKAIPDREQYAVLDGEWRRGLKDLQDAVLVAFPESMKSRDEAATIANPTQQIVTNEIKGNSLDDLRESAAARASVEPSPERTNEQEKGMDR